MHLQTSTITSEKISSNKNENVAPSCPDASIARRISGSLNQLKCLEQHHSEVLSDGASMNDRDEECCLAQLSSYGEACHLPVKRQKLAAV